MKDLVELYKIHSPSNSKGLTNMLNYLCKWLKEHKIPYTNYKGNLYNFTGSKFILSAHMDQVETNGAVEHLRLSADGFIKGYNKDWQRTSLGADDKNGIWIIQKVLLNHPDTSFIISCNEEVGCVGIKDVDDAGILKDNITKDNVCIVLDRKDDDNILKSGSTGDYCSTLAQDLCNYLGSYRYKVTSGTLSDTSVLCKYCESVNMSVAYTEAHTKNEKTNWNSLVHILEDVESVIDGFIHYGTDPSVYVENETKVYKYNKKGYYDDYYWKNY